MDTEGTRMRICEYLFRVRSVFHPWFQWLHPFRQAEELAEGQKSAKIKHFSSRHPLRQPRQLAEWVEFPEKNVGFCHSRAPFGGRGSDRPKLHPLFKFDSFWTADSIPEVLW